MKLIQKPRRVEERNVISFGRNEIESSFSHSQNKCNRSSFLSREKVHALSSLIPIFCRNVLVASRLCKNLKSINLEPFVHAADSMYVCLLITLTRSPKAELRRAQLNGIGRMHMKGAPGCRQTVMNDPGAQQPSQMSLTWVKAKWRIVCGFFNVLQLFTTRIVRWDLRLIVLIREDLKV